MARPWVVKFDGDGTKRWHSATRNSFLNASKSSFLSVQQAASTRNYVAVGYAADTRDSDPSKFYLGMIRSDGLFLWDKMYGGSGDERAYAVQDWGTLGFMAAGFTTSNDGNVSGNHHAGTADAWLVQFNTLGNIVWQKCFGGSGADTAFAMVRTLDNGFLVAGTSTSSDGDLNTNAGGTDAWVFKIDSLGNLQWQKSFGGGGNEAFKNILLNNDGTYTLVGCSTSTGYLGNTNAGRNDVWVVKMDASGEIIWSRLFGGTMDDQAFSVQRTPLGNYIVCGYTQSTDGHVTGSNGATDAWLLKISPSGNLLWQKAIGTNRDEAAFGVVCTSENNFFVAGFGKPAGYNDNDGYVVGLANSNVIKGTLFLDYNLNGIKDAGETFFSQQATVTVQKQGVFSSSIITQNGRFSLDVDTGSYVTSVQANQIYYNVVPVSRNSNFATYGNSDSLSFAVQPISNKKDLVISIIPHVQAFTPAMTFFTKMSGCPLYLQVR